MKIIMKMEKIIMSPEKEVASFQSVPEVITFSL
jgi:hypothetical protein